MNDPTGRFAAPAASQIPLAGHLLDLDAQLLRDASGAAVELRPQAWAVLRLLALRAGRVVTKEQLLASVWPDRVVTDGSLAQAISDIRAAFGAAGHDVVRTVARRGYLLVTAAAADVPAVERRPTLPAAPGPLFGRAAELETLGALLDRHRLVSVTGAGGIGKTSLALAAAHARAVGNAERAAWVDLARLADATLLPATLAQALGLPIVQRGDPLPGLIAALRPLDALVVMDNAEHLVDAVARLTRLMLDAAPSVRWLVTSQAPLRIDGEYVLRLGPLDLPETDSAALDQAERSGAVALFVEQARALDPAFALTAQNAGTVVRLCRRLEGLPLAIRLAAARLPLFGLSGLESHLDQRLQLLAAERRDAPARQQTLLAALAWSYGLLAAPEQALFLQLGAFVGGFTLALAAAAADDGEWAIADRLGRLVERSLVELEPGHPPRYRLLESQREFVLRQLGTHDGALRAARERHARAMAGAMLAAGDTLWSTPDADWLARWAPELDNVRAALDWSRAHDTTLFVTLVGGSPGLFRLLDLGYELRFRAAAVEVEAVAGTDAALQMRYWQARAQLQSGVAAQPMHDFALEGERLARCVGDPRWLYRSLCQRVSSSVVPAHEAASLLAEIAALESPAWPPRERALRQAAEFVVHNLERRWPRALEAAETGFELACEAGAVASKAIFANWIVVALLDLQDVAAAVRRSRALRPDVLPGPAAVAIPFVGTCARCALQAGDIAGAKRQLAQMFEMCRSVDWANFDFFANLYLRVALGEGRFDDAARLLGYAAAATRRAWHLPRFAPHRDEAQAALARVIDEARLAQLCAEGERLSPERVCALVLAGPPPAPPPQP